jgi:putative DNA primase/helicase
VILLTNHKPRVLGTEEAIWRRLRLVPFTTTFWDPNDPCKDPSRLPGSLRQDKQLGEKLASQEEREGILAWLVRGCLDWRREGLTLPEKVKVATSEYRYTEDVLAQWIEERCITGGPNLRGKASVLYANFRDWYEKSGEEGNVPQAIFGSAMIERGYDRIKSNDTKWYLGIALVENEP